MSNTEWNFRSAEAQAKWTPVINEMEGVDVKAPGSIWQEEETMPYCFGTVCKKCRKQSPTAWMMCNHRVDTRIDKRRNKKLLIKRLVEHAVLPKRESEHAAGYDLCSSVDVIIPKHGKGLVGTGLSMALPDKCYGRIAPRSGLAAKNFIDVGAGVIDRDYRGPVGVLLFNHSDTDFDVKKGDRIAQIIFERIKTPSVVEVDELDVTQRNEGGFGSTGINTI